MKYRRTLPLTCLGLALLWILPVQAQSNGQMNTRLTANEASAPLRASPAEAAYSPENTRSTATARVRKPHWFDERRRKEAKEETGGSFERLSYTPYTGEGDTGSGSCVYSQNTYTYSCR